VLQGLADKPAFRGRGLLARFLYAVPKSWIGSRDVNPPTVPPAVTEGYEQLVRQLCRCPLEGTITLSASAFHRLLEWSQEVEGKLAEGSELEAIHDWDGKLVGTTVRLAAIMHCVKHVGVNPCLSPIDAETFEAAIVIAKYLSPHAEHVQTCVHSEAQAPLELPQVLLRWIARNKLERFSKRDAHQANRRKFKSAELLEEPLALLTGRGYLRPIPVRATGAGHPPSPEYKVNPLYLEPVNAGSRSHKTHSSPMESRQGILRILRALLALVPKA
jgi:hypothetical protein